MIDFEKELKNFGFFEVDKEFLDLRNETNKSVQAFNSTLKKLRKEQSEVVYQVEEIVESLDEIKNSFDKTSGIEKFYEDSETEKLGIIKGLVSILDQVEDFYKFVNKADSNWKNQFDMIWKNINNMLMVMGMTRIENVNTIFNPKINSAKSVFYDANLEEGQVIEVIRSGYMYKSNVIRKAEVVVNKKSEEGDFVE